MTIYHKHHIIPRHMGGTDEPSNLIRLTIEEHAEAHKKLWEEHNKQEDYIAWKCLSGQISNAELYDMLNRLPKTEEHKRKLSIARRKRTITDKMRIALAVAREKMNNDPEHLEKLRERMKGNNYALGNQRVFTEEHKKKISEGLKKVCNEPKHRKNISERMKNNNYALGYVNEIVACPHCGKTGGGGAMKRWHFDNCKENTSEKI